jgi:serine/threonine protein kinase
MMSVDSPRNGRGFRRGSDASTGVVSTRQSTTVDVDDDCASHENPHGARRDSVPVSEGPSISRRDSGVISPLSTSTSSDDVSDAGTTYSSEFSHAASSATTPPVIQRIVASAPPEAAPPVVAPAATAAPSLLAPPAPAGGRGPDVSPSPVLLAPEDAAPRAPQQQRQRTPNIALGNKELIGAGSYGSVFRALEIETNRTVAVKEIVLQTVESQATNEQIRTLQREIRVMQRLNHPNIVKYLGASRDGATFSIVMEFVAGGTVSEIVKKFGNMQPSQSARITKQALLGLEYLHGKGIIHRDLKGDNLFVEVDGTLKVGDFGTAKELRTIRLTSSMAGTPYFMAPEVVKCEQYGVQADVWSIGCCVIQMLSGKPPYHRCDNQFAVMFQVSKGEVDSYIPTDLPPAVDDFIRQCTRLNPAERPSVSELLQHPWLAGVPLAPGASPLTQSGPSFGHAAPFGPHDTGMTPMSTPPTTPLDEGASPTTPITEGKATPTTVKRRISASPLVATKTNSRTVTPIKHRAPGGAGGTTSASGAAGATGATATGATPKKPVRRGTGVLGGLPARPSASQSTREKR